MTVNVSLEARFQRTREGMVWAQRPFGTEFWGRYLQVFDRVRIIARVRDVEVPPGDSEAIASRQVLIHAIPDYHGPLGFAMHARKVAASISGAVGPDDAAILRIPSPLGGLLRRVLDERRQPYAVEVVGDPMDALSRGANRSPARALARVLLRREMRRQCYAAAAAAYVTRDALQRRYPACRSAITACYSSVELDTGDYAAEGWRPSTRSSGPRLALVGTLEQPYKGHDTAISAVRILASRGFEASLAIAGSGKYLSDFQRYASEAGIIDSIQFAGVMGTKARLWEFLGNADILLVPSRAEGLPRVLLEGMARGLPCVGSNVGGIPELLEPDFLITPGDSVQLADRIQWLWTSPGVMIAAGRRNLEVAKQHHRAILEPRRRQFYSDVARLAGAARSRAHTTHLEDE